MKRLLIFAFAGLLATSAVAQVKKARQERRPANSSENLARAIEPQQQPPYDYFSILDGTPVLLQLRHDTVADTGQPIDVYKYVIELQVMNSDGNLEPEGLDIFNFYTAKAVSPDTAPNPHTARDCAKWNNIINQEIRTRPDVAVWPYVELTVAQGARMIETNEDGLVWWSDDIQCWGSEDRFSPF
ncbi:MAG TPA: hypothetical protein VMP68_15050 [Candidatus Eisenbacteria bacterium]|nr:hypothetical protein [Candidatus Eisenbacteria bacterium]